MLLCKCGQPAELKWTVNGDISVRQEHKLCGSCMSVIWNKITSDYKGSNALENSSFERVN